MSENRKRNLVICRAGDHSLHPHWLTLSDKQFDLWVDYYGGTQAGKYRDTCDVYRESGGLKYTELYNFIKEYYDRVFEYNAVWLPDDDIETDTETINRLFLIFHQYNLCLAQPSIICDSRYSHAITMNHPEFELRYTNWVEAMAPIFSREALKICLETFSESKSGWGIDNAWSQLLRPYTDKIGIIDAVSVKHTREPGKGELFKAYQELNIVPYEELKRLNAKYKFDNKRIVYRGIAKVK